MKLMGLWRPTMYLRAVSLMIHNTIKESGAAEDFLGHISPTDFVVGHAAGCHVCISGADTFQA
ncbi:MAG: hypothetical protein MZV70_21780 [Desulfobacterales bacterium]|nr:hypothetical protein [Desulfobacterales bacterium]